MKYVPIALMAALVFGCSGAGDAECESVSHDGESYCVYQGAITETGYECPQDLERLHRDAATELVVCSANEEPPPFEELDELLDARPTSNEPNLTIPDESRTCIDENLDGTMLSHDYHGACEYGFRGECEESDLEAEVRQACRDAEGSGCDDTYITREAALCIAAEAGFPESEWPAMARLQYRDEFGAVWSVAVLTDVVDDGVEGEGVLWDIDARTGEIVNDTTGFGWIN